MGCCASADDEPSAAPTPAPAPAPPAPVASAPAPAPKDQYIYDNNNNNKNSGPVPLPPVTAPAPVPVPQDTKYEAPTAPAPAPLPDDMPPDQPTSNAKLPRAGAAPTGGAYRGWAPPTKEHFSETASKGQKKRVMVEDQWDEDGNLTRITTTKTFAPDWKTTTQTEFIPAAKAAEMGIERKTAWS